MTLIKREDAIEAVAKLQKYDLDERNRLRIYAPWHGAKRIFVETEAIYKTIYTLPSAEAEWIPCSERLPREDGCYLVSTTGTNNDIIDIAYYTEEIWHKASRIKAWMPLPKPYREDGEV